MLNPKIRLRKYRETGFIEQVEPLFPSYIFVKFDPIEDYYMIKYARGVRKIVSFAGKIVPLQDELIEFISHRLTDGVAQVA